MIKCIDSYQVSIPGKCIIAGEHAVLQGYDLLAKSVPHYFVSLKYTPSNSAITLDVNPKSTLSNENLMTYFYLLLDKALNSVGYNARELTGIFSLHTNIPISTGMGFSAAICHALAKWVEHQGWLEDQDLFEYTRMLEDMFHGKSSGADIAAVCTNDIILFNKQKDISTVHAIWQPELYISQTNTICYTSEAVKKVNHFRQTQGKYAEDIDLKMHLAVSKLLLALNMHNSSRLALLAEAINDANECFKTWDLIPKNMADNMKQLIDAGAIAVKPTGSGGGGSILSLWYEPPSDELKNHLIKIF